MPTDSTSLLTETLDLSSEITWRNLTLSLGSFARSLVYSFHVPSWRGQEEDIIEDIVQETARRIIERIQKAERGEADPVQSLPKMITIIAQNYQEQLLTQVAREIANFPKKQRKALLIDLANRMYFDKQPTPLQKAFLEAGIQLEQYRQPLPKDIQERNQHASLLNHANKRIAQLPCVQEYKAETLQSQVVFLSKTERNAQKN